ncbi:UDP-N-acetylglucosamine 2-epimerase [Micractinium conductrix]|uniref:UDP-N-acetylglucosamine 2-epimerase n=1 Tax=Micractinium conductrix TaxID=554055 RepID=A0A2P6VI87_9CHLO|nr:UDP-N-acetylglucosamine 2-epimerase [Micractinium conductrix]|eukprot:PSC73777.1 UDP-N-acetylglucosamine 2-epimerase [Micractinium conductrix]
MVGGQHQEGVGERVRHVAEEVVHVAGEVMHKAEDAVHKVADTIHERRERAHEEAERGMFTADDITEAEELARRAHEHLPLHPEKQGVVGRSAKPREYKPDEEEALLEDASSDVAQPYRQKELESLRNVLKEDQEPGAAGGKGGSA